SYPAIEFNSGDFSFDAWIKPQSQGTILSKYDAATQKGYIVFLDLIVGGGSGTYYPVGIILGNGSGFSFLYPGCSVQQGVWSHLAVTVQRGVAGGVVCYVNGQP